MEPLGNEMTHYTRPFTRPSSSLWHFTMDTIAHQRWSLKRSTTSREVPWSTWRSRISKICTHGWSRKVWTRFAHGYNRASLNTGWAPFCPRLRLQRQLALEVLWEIVLLLGDHFSYDVHSLSIHSQSQQDIKIRTCHRKDILHLHTAGMRPCHRMKLSAHVLFAEVSKDSRIVVIALLHFQFWDKERISWEHRLELPLTHLFVLAT